MTISVSPWVLGVDPGLGGAVALFDANEPRRSQVWPMPLTRSGQLDSRALACLISALRTEAKFPIQGAVESVHSRPHQAGVFNFGLGTGIIHGILAANDIPFILVAPSVWKVRMGLQRHENESQADTKDRARALASQLFPWLADQFKLKKDDGKAEALLLAVYTHHHYFSEKRS